MELLNDELTISHFVTNLLARIAVQYIAHFCVSPSCANSSKVWAAPDITVFATKRQRLSVKRDKKRTVFGGFFGIKAKIW